jgi:hypothetical protein
MERGVFVRLLPSPWERGWGVRQLFLKINI